MCAYLNQQLQRNQTHVQSIAAALSHLHLVLVFTPHFPSSQLKRWEQKTSVLFYFLTMDLSYSFVFLLLKITYKSNQKSSYQQEYFQVSWKLKLKTTKQLPDDVEDDDTAFRNAALSVGIVRLHADHHRVP